jgi:hypothetical protein
MVLVARAAWAAATVLALTVLAPGHQATARVADATEPCTIGELHVSADLNPIPTVYAAGQTGTHPATVGNPTGVDLTDAFFDVGLVVPPNTTNPGTAPTVSWNIDNGAWHAAGLNWVARPAPQQSYWQSADTDLPTLAAGTTHTLRFRVSFHADDPAGFYPAPLTLGAHMCGINHLGDTYNMQYDYFTDCGPSGVCGHGGAKATSTSGSHTAPATVTHASPSPAAPDPSPAVVAASPSPPAVSESAALPTSSGMPVARVVPASDSSPLPWIGSAALVVVALAVASGVLWRRRHHAPSGTEPH